MQETNCAVTVAAAAPCHPHLRKTKQAKNQNRIKNDVGERADEHQHHWHQHVAGSLKHLFKIDMKEVPAGKTDDNHAVLTAHCVNIGIVGEKADERFRKQQAEQE